MKTKKITLRAADVKTIIKDLSVVVVSMDHIGSTYYNAPRECAMELGKFLDPRVFRRLARARGILSKAFNSQCEKSEVLQLEQEAENLPYWHE